MAEKEKFTEWFLDNVASDGLYIDTYDLDNEVIEPTWREIERLLKQQEEAHKKELSDAIDDTHDEIMKNTGETCEGYYSLKEKLYKKYGLKGNLVDKVFKEKSEEEKEFDYEQDKYEKRIAEMNGGK